jgi:gas vesicle structural protein
MDNLHQLSKTSSVKDIERTTNGTQSIEILDRVLDKGIVIDAEYRYALLRIDVFDIDGHCVVPSGDTYLRYTGPIARRPLVRRLHSRPEQQLSFRSRREGVGVRRSANLSERGYTGVRSQGA